MSKRERPGATAATARSRASRTAAWTSRARVLAGPTETVRVKSTQYESWTPPKSSTTRSPSTNVRSPGRACGSAALGPLATIVSNAERSNPASLIRQSMANATSRSVWPGRTEVTTPAATRDSRRAASRGERRSRSRPADARPLDNPPRSRPAWAPARSGPQASPSARCIARRSGANASNPPAATRRAEQRGQCHVTTRRPSPARGPGIRRPCRAWRQSSSCSGSR